MGNSNEQNTPSYELFFNHFFTSIDKLNVSEDYSYDIYNTTINTYGSSYTSDNNDKILRINKIFEITKQEKNRKKEKQKQKKKVGRKKKRDNQIKGKEEKYHSKYDYDNIIRKIQVHFQNFLVSFINEVLMHFGFIKRKFLNLDYNIKKDIKKENFEKLKSQEIGEILRQNITTKYKKQCKIDKEKNNKLYLEVINYNDNIKKILSESYLHVFRNIYHKNKRDLNDYGLNLILSNKVKTYQDLLDNVNNEDEDINYIEKINDIVKEYYLPKKIFIHN